MNDSLQNALQGILARIRAAESRAGRAAGSVTLLPVSKTFGEQTIREAAALGLTRLGENKVQEIRAKFEPLADCGIRWVMIGHLQTNKAKDVARMADEVQSVDRLELALALQKRLEQAGRDGMDVLVQVKTSPEPSKYGAEPQALPSLLRAIAAEAPLLRVRGLMTLATNSGDAAVVRDCFRRLRLLRDAVAQEGIAGVSLERLSMGMSGDFEIAIDEGSTEVRVGTALFGARGDRYSDYWPESAAPQPAAPESGA